MRQATTPTHTFELPFDTSLIDKVRVTYKQGDALVIDKRREDCTMEGQTIRLTLTQEETLALDPDYGVDIQLQVLTTGGNALTSDIYTRTVYEVQSGEVLA